MIGLHPLENRDRKLIRVVRLNVMVVTEQHQVGLRATLLVGHGRVEALTARHGRLDVADLADPLPLVIDQPPITARERALVAGPQKQVAQRRELRREALGDFFHRAETLIPARRRQHQNARQATRRNDLDAASATTGSAGPRRDAP